jgi:hypothetical protein
MLAYAQWRMIAVQYWTVTGLPLATGAGNWHWKGRHNCRLIAEPDGRGALSRYPSRAFQQ